MSPRRTTIRKANAIPARSVGKGLSICHSPSSQSQSTYQEENRIPNIHMLKKPSWYTGKSRAPPIIEEVEYESLKRDVDPFSSIQTVEYQKIDVKGTIWKSMISVPMLILLALPFLAVASLTLFHFGALPDTLTPYMFASTEQKNDATVLAGFWVLALVAFVPWSATISRLENWVSQQIE